MTKTDTSRDGLTQIEKLRLYVEHDLSSPCLDSLNDEVTALLTERDALQTRAERAEAGLKAIEREWDPSEDSINAKTMYEIANATLAQLDAEPAEPITRDDMRDLMLVDEPGQTHREVWEQCKEAAAIVARNACLVPPDGGSPTEAEVALCDEAERRIRAMPYPGDSQ